MADSLPDRSLPEAEAPCQETFEATLARIFQMLEGDTLAEADRLLAQSRLQTFRQQMNPHFLFNALNSIEALSREAPCQIPEFVRALSEYLRYALHARQDGLATMQQELEAVASYLRVEQIRFEDQLEVEFAIAEAARCARVPELLLQPLVEQAIQRGMSTSSMPLRVVISARCLDGCLHVEVRHTGAWAVAEIGGDLGWQHLRRRLDLWYTHDGYRLTLRESVGWATLAIEIPCEA